MENDFIITSTNTIQGAEINNYFGVINTNVVLGTNIFSDIGAGFTDIFGGSSNIYQNKLRKIYDSAIDELKIRAKELGANGILGLSIDFDEISGGNKSMFMISVSGTAVSINYNQEIIIESTNDSISKHDLNKELMRRKIIQKANEEILLTQEEWYFIIQHKIDEIAENLLNTFIKKYDTDISASNTKRTVFKNGIQTYFKRIEKSISTKLLYDKVKENFILTFDILKYCDLFSSDRIIELIKEKYYKTAIECLTIESNFYSKKDLNNMLEILTLLDNMEDLGHIKTTTGLLGKEKKKYICPNGHHNNSDMVYCEYCHKDIKGLYLPDVKKIDEFRLKVNTLKDFLN